MGVIIGTGNGRIKCKSCGRESGESDNTLHGFKKTIYYDTEGFETTKETLCLKCAGENLTIKTDGDL